MKKNLIYSDPYKLLVFKLIEVRKSSGLNQSDLGSLLGESQRYVSRIENMEKSLNLEELNNFCKALDIDVLELFATYIDNLERYKQPQNK